MLSSAVQRTRLAFFLLRHHHSWRQRRHYNQIMSRNVQGTSGVPTLEQFATVRLAGRDLERHDVALRLVEEFDGDADCGRHGRCVCVDRALRLERLK